ncbi:hypothetical protein C2845_PM06G10200 [Panicum miliaceum]|uniref:KANL3/Tex30 alpha/beta hydrolase-like domain-containing protein n=1 Tax=Panicum miliaceum TaxID=4540 RepID=A0A3L6R6N1_PANMI|nr:hypothetical protein C2845_PM06G10200 [Panicum miliaceum]
MSGGKRRAPPKAEKLVDHHLGVVKDAAAKYQGHPLILMGKSMGSRLESTRKKMTCKNELHVIDGGDHSFKIGKKYLESRGLNQHDVEMEAVKAISQFVQNSFSESCT